MNWVCFDLLGFHKIETRSWSEPRSAAALLSVGFLTCGWLGCSSAVSAVPLSNAAKESRDVYLYGPPAGGIASLASTTLNAEPETEDDNSRDRDSGAEDEADLSSSAAKDKRVTDKESEEDAHESDVSATKPPRDVSGTYQGTDWVTITLPGFPEDEQVDDQARVVLKVLDKPERYSFAVLDTRSGDELCKINGTLNEAALTFDDDQTCFAGILGIPMEATVLTGVATLDGNALVVDLGINLSVSTPNGDVSGDLDYRFEGKKNK